MKIIAHLFLACLFIWACSSRKQQMKSYNGKATFETFEGNKQLTPLLRDNVFALDSISIDKSYGYTPANPILVGGFKDQQGAFNQQRFLNALLGPEAQRVLYVRTNSCCGFSTPNSMMGTGLLDRYKVFWEDAKDTSYLYLNFYDAGPLKAPLGFQFRKRLERE